MHACLPPVCRTAAFLAVCTLLTACAALVSVPPGTVCSVSAFSVQDDFPGARRGRCTPLGSHEVRLDIRPESSGWINDSPWYAFRLKPAGPGTAVIQLRYTRGHHRYPPKISHDEASWQVLPESSVEVAEDGTRATLRLPLTGESTWVAAQELVTSHTYADWLDSLSTHEGVTILELGRSAAGLPIQALDAGAAGADAVLLVGRQHPPEVSGAIAFFSFVERLLADDDLAVSFRRVHRVLAIPVLNPDGVDAGHWRHNLGGVDLNRDWGPFTQPETRAVQSLLDELARENAGPAVFIDFHSTNRNLFYLQAESEPTEPPRFADIWLDTARTRLTGYEFSKEPRVTSDTANGKNYVHRRYGVPAMTYEVGDETDRGATRRAAAVLAEEFMRLLLAAASQARPERRISSWRGGEG